MKRFHFSLHAVERFRKTRELEALKGLVIARNFLTEQKKIKEDLVARLHRSFEDRSQLGKVAVGVWAFCVEQDFIEGTKVRITQQDQAILRAERMVEKASQKYYQSKKERAALTKLREREWERYREELAKHETRLLDDVYTSRANRSIFGVGA